MPEGILSFLIFFPLVSALALFILPSLNLVKIASLISTLISFVAVMFLWFAFDGSTANLQFVEAYEWMPDFGIRYIVGIDGISLLLVVLTNFLTLLVIISQWHQHSDGARELKQKTFFSLILALQSGMLGALLALDLVFFYVFWEAMLIPMYFIIGVWGGERKIYAATKFVIYTVVGSLLMLVAALALYFIYHQQFGVYSTSLLDLYQITLDPKAQIVLFLAFAVAFAIKVPLFPFHTWLPDAHVEAPTVGSVILAGVLLKMGTYGLLRFAIPLFPAATLELAPLFMGLGVTGIIYGALVAWMQTDAKKLVAYSSVSHLGFVVIGSMAFLADKKLSVEALTGATYQMINHGISTGALFFLVGVIYERRHTRQLKDFGGLAAVMPYYSIMLIIATLSSIGLPGTGGFIGEFLILLGTFQSSKVFGGLAALGVLLGAIYMLTLCKAILFGPVTIEENKKLKDLSPREFLYLTPLCVLALLMGIYPNLFLGKINKSVEYLAKNYDAYKIAFHDIDKTLISTDEGR